MRSSALLLSDKLVRGAHRARKRVYPGSSSIHIRMQAGALDIAVPAERTWMELLPS